MRKFQWLLVLGCLLLGLGCKDKETFGSDSAECEAAMAELVSTRYHGIIYMGTDHLFGAATVVAGSGDLVSVHLVADSTAFDTTLFYTATCFLAEKIYPNIRLKHPVLEQVGYAQLDPNSIAFGFERGALTGDNACWFEGYE